MNKKNASKSNSNKATTVSNKASSKPAPKTTSKKAVSSSQEQIAVRAYFISEQRQKTGRGGDHLSDWIEAEQQLMGQ